jgi:hypothetical protein
MSAGRRSAPAAEFLLDCPCGKAVTVVASKAGSTVTCECGAEVKVPSLGRLREMAGKDRYESGPGDTIRRMIRSGELPAGTTCAVSRKATGDFIELEILVPRYFKNTEIADRRMILLFGTLGALYNTVFRRPQIEKEGALIVRAPILVAERCHAKVRRMSQTRLRRLLRSVPVYAQLLKENPHSRISVGK